MDKANLIAAAREYLGAPFHHQGRCLDGIDCAGLIVQSCLACGYEVNDQQGYAPTPSRDLFLTAVLEHCDPIAFDMLEPGDLLMFRFTSESQHIALVTTINPIAIIHAYLAYGKVIEHALDDAWRKRLTGCYRLKTESNRND